VDGWGTVGLRIWNPDAFHRLEDDVGVDVRRVGRMGGVERDRVVRDYF
jgi:hypothetical protein